MAPLVRGSLPSGPARWTFHKLELLMAPLSAILEPSWVILGPSWAISGPFGGILGPSWGHLGASWGHLGPILGPSWVQGALQQVIYEFPRCSIIPGLAECAKRLNNSPSLWPMACSDLLYAYVYSNVRSLCCISTS